MDKPIKIDTEEELIEHVENLTKQYKCKMCQDRGIIGDMYEWMTCPECFDSRKDLE